MLHSFDSKVINGSPHYFIIEEIGDLKGIEDFKTLLAETMKTVSNENIKTVSVVLNQQESLNSSYIKYLKDLKFVQHEIQYFYHLDLTSIHDFNDHSSFTLKSLEHTSEDLFKEVWQQSMALSLNAPSQTTIGQQFEGMKSEIGDNYAKSCLIVFKENEPIGVTMPHIEQGTVDEGRLFYLGFIPEYRGKGHGALIHRQSLGYLKQIGAKHYIGATGHKNLPMQKIFNTNNCHLFDKRVTYRHLIKSDSIK
ncbi:TPA: GNAT family N-acetyltransferase [Bacillus mycoides]|uniref:GNAT family N-acetyltransferase n=1 Tax=Bacillus sp. FSL P2-0099 TaxID=2921572 RepID=UPI0030F7548C|nr:GNAT family N-acetyltransferase [Bacillus mycoides]